MNQIIQLKKKIIIKILRYLFFLLVSTQAVPLSAQVKFSTVTSSNEIGRSDYVQVQFVISNAKQIEQFSPPTFPDFQTVEGPSQSSGMSNINGNISQYQSVSYVLQPTKMGKFTITGATATVDGKPMHSNSVTINVTAGSSANNSHNNAIQPFFHPIWPDEPEVNKEYVLKPGENVADVLKKNLFVKVQVSKTKCYVGEPLVATYKLYSCLRSESRVTKLPSMNGFSVYDMVDPNKSSPTYETINGKKFTVNVIRKAQLIPLQPGTVILDPVEIENDVYFIKAGARARHHNNLLDDFFDNFSDEESGNMIEQHVTLNSAPVEVTINSLPEKNKPADFNGAVGSFNIDAKLENKKIAARDEGILKLTINGKGNLPMVNAPQITWPSTIDGYDATAKENIDKTVAPMAGSKTFDYVFSPKTRGDYTIPAVDFTYFDPSINNYKTIKTAPVEFSAAPESKKSIHPANLATPAYAEPGELKTFIQDHLEWIFAVLIVSLVAGYLWRQSVKIKKAELEKAAAAKVENEQKQVLSPEQRDPLLRAKKFLEYSDFKGFYQELNRTTWNFLSDRLKLRSSELNKQNVIRQLQLHGWSDHDILHIEDILHKCEMNLYTPDYSEINSQQLLQETENLLSKLS
jgi:BatD DUF11 like domain